MYYNNRYAYTTRRRRYGFMHFLFDATLTVVTGGLWLVYLIFRHLHNG